MDVSFWGPSGWRLLHLITFTVGGLEEKKELLSTLDDVLPCKYCRASAKVFLHEEPVKNNVAVWLYDFHEKVNDKLKKQHAEDPTVPLPAPSPTFPQVVKHYQHMLKDRTESYPGRDFLLSIALNYDRETHNSASHKKFWKNLLKLYPYYEYRKKMFMPDFDHYFRDVHKMFQDMGCRITLGSSKKQVSKHKSSCSTKKGGRTCKKLRRTRRL
jgi:hypothetical protein